MNFELIELEEFRKYADNSPYKSFYQTPEIAKLREQNGWTAYYFGVKNAAKLVAAAMVVAKPTFLGKSIYYCPGGPLLDYEDANLTTFFFKNLKQYAKSHNGYVFHIEPYYELIERGRHGEVVEGGFNHEIARNNLRAAGLIPLAESDEPKYAFVMDIASRTPEQIFKDFKANTRNHVRKAEKMGVKIRELTREELPIFKQITESTSARRNFQDKPLSYYEQMYDLFHERGEIMFIVAEAELGNSTIEGISERGSARVSAFSPVATGENDATRNGAISSSETVPMSAAMFMLYGDEVIYLFSGSEEKYMKEYNAQYLIQWHMIKYAAKHGFKRYNFYGIQGLPSKGSKDYGIYDFKKGFDSTKNGHVTELIGAHEMPVNQPFYQLHHLLSKLKNR